MNKKWKLWGISMFGCVVLAGCSTANAQQVFVNQIEQELRANDHQVATRLQLGITDLEGVFDKNHVLALLEDVSLIVEVHQDFLLQQVDFLGRLSSVPTPKFSPLHVISLGTEQYVNAPFVADLISLVEDSSASDAAVKALKHQYLNVADLVDAEESDEWLQQLGSMFLTLFDATGSRQTDESRRAHQALIEALKQMPAARFAQSGDRVTLTMGPEELGILRRAAASLTEDTQISNRMIKQASELVDNLKNEYDVFQIMMSSSMRERAFTIELRVEPKAFSDLPFRKLGIRLDVTAIDFVPPVAPEATNIIATDKFYAMMKLLNFGSQKTQESAATDTMFVDGFFSDKAFEDFYHNAERVSESFSEQQKVSYYASLMADYGRYLTIDQVAKLKELLFP